MLMREMAPFGIFQRKSASQEWDQFWQELATDRNYQDF